MSFHAKSGASPTPALMAPPHPGGRAPEDQSTRAEGHRREAAALRRQGRVEAALRELLLAAEKVPLTPVLAATLVRLSVLARMEGAARQVLEHASREQDPKVQLTALRQLARLARREGAYEGALELYREILKRNPEDRRAQAVRERLGRALDPTVRSRPPPDRMATDPGTTQKIQLPPFDEPARPPPPRRLSAPVLERLPVRSMLERARATPLEPAVYRALAEAFRGLREVRRAQLVDEIADAVEGLERPWEPPPNAVLAPGEVAGLRHPVLRGDCGELLRLSGLALVQVFGDRRSGVADVPFHLDAGPGARHAADALVASVRVLGLPSPEPYLALGASAPFGVAYVGGVRLLVSGELVQRPLPVAPLRFFAGRALVSQSPDCLALRILRKQQLLRALTVLGEVMRGRVANPEARALKAALPTKAWERLSQLYPRVEKAFDLEPLAEAARHTGNRAGLVASGGVHAALSALRWRKALPAEQVELLHFASSARYFRLWLRLSQRQRQ